MKKLLISLGICAAVSCGGASARTVGAPTYVHVKDLQAALKAGGLGGHAVTNSSCSGFGTAHADFPNQTFHSFVCFITTAAAKHVKYQLTVSTGTPGHFEYKAVKD